jgi:hypothetical protein
MACAPASNWRADPEGSNSKSLGAKVASDGGFASIGFISAALERGDRSIRVPALDTQ